MLSLLSLLPSASVALIASFAFVPPPYSGGGLGGTYAALGGWALVSREPAADAAVGVTWLGAAAVRIATRKIDRPPATASYWVYLGLELSCGVMSLASATARRRGVKKAAVLVPAR